MEDVIKACEQNADLSEGDKQSIAKWLTELLEYRYSEADGYLVDLPCKIGETMWCIRRCGSVERPRKGVVSDMYFSPEMKLIIVVKGIARGVLGEKVFLTRKDAEKAIKMREEKK